ncbi:probable 39S ribosomal protein L49, mitochondrial [Schistocerca nitens]|uniref:probable 39S ribosomal protein L49, mitochondrial n=1 Tax=Schistocerca nitens TaxID=7011 RepID=UPI002117EEB9|nr:probable 39S ribosomal protein L49, mitochondrial [Schistocerca nitens]
MAALRVGIRSCTTLFTPNSCLCGHYGLYRDVSRLKTLPSLRMVLSRNSSYRSSSEEGPKELYTGFEISSSPEEWQWVERLLGPKVVPQPKPKADYPSGWKPPSDAALSLPYFVKRNKNYMLPVYLNIKFRGQRRITVVRNIQGDIWLMERELREHLESVVKKPVVTMVHEVCCLIKVKGDVYLPVEQWLYQKGF